MNETSKKIIALLLVVVGIAFIIFNRISSKPDTSMIVDEARTEVKSEVYQAWGEVPTSLSGKIIYSNDKDYIVVVKYGFDGLDEVGSHACHIHVYGNDACLNGMTQELAYDYPYNVEELKALWAIK